MDAPLYDQPEGWEPVASLPTYKFKDARIMLVGRALPSRGTAPKEYLMAVAFLQPTRNWTVDREGKTPLGWEPTYFAGKPNYPPWPPREHPEMAGYDGPNYPPDYE